MTDRAPARQPTEASRSHALCAGLLLAIVALGAWLRLHGLGGRSLWYDEVMTVIYTGRGYLEMWLHPTDPTPPLYYTVHKLIAGGSTAPAAVRGLAAAFGIAAIPVMYLLGRILFNRATGLCAAAFLAVSGPLIEYSQEARAYSLLFLLVLASACGLAGTLKDWQRGEPRRWAPQVAFHLFAVAALYTHFTAIFWLFGANLVLLAAAAAGPGRRRKLLRWVSGAVWTLLALLPVPFMMAGGGPRFIRLPPLAPRQVLETLGDLVFARASWIGDQAGTAILSAALLLGIARAARNRPALLVIAALCVFVASLWAAQVARPVFMFRTTLVFAAAPVLLLAVAAASLPGLLRPVAAAGLGGLLLASHFAYLENGPRATDWDGAVDALTARLDEADVVIVCPAFEYQSIRFRIPPEDMVEVVGVARADLARLYPLDSDPYEVWENRDIGEMQIVSPAELSASRQPGSSAWIVDANCAPGRKEALDGFVAGLGKTPEPVWQGTGVTISSIRF